MPQVQQRCDYFHLAVVFYRNVSSLLQVVVQVKPVYSPPQLFPIGKETITYITTDRSGNQANCSFTVTVIGEHPFSYVCLCYRFRSLLQLTRSA